MWPKLASTFLKLCGDSAVCLPEILNLAYCRKQKSSNVTYYLGIDATTPLLLLTEKSTSQMSATRVSK